MRRKKAISGPPGRWCGASGHGARRRCAGAHDSAAVCLCRPPAHWFRSMRGRRLKWPCRSRDAVSSRCRCAAGQITCCPGRASASSPSACRSPTPPSTRSLHPDTRILGAALYAIEPIVAQQAEVPHLGQLMTGCGPSRTTGNLNRVASRRSGLAFRTGDAAAVWVRAAS